MNKAIFFYPYIAGSGGLYRLTREILKSPDVKALVINLKGSKFRYSKNKMIVNWGSSADRIRDMGVDEYGRPPNNILNPANAVSVCANKLTFFNHISGRCSHPEFTTSRRVAEEWLAEGSEVLARTTLSGHSGDGIHFMSEGSIAAKLYVKYIKKLEEFRVHVFKGQVIDVQQKKLRTTDDEGNAVDPKDIDFRVRSYRNGFVFARNDVYVPDCVTKEALSAFAVIPGLDFGAFDVIYNKSQGRAYVLECNTAPGVEGQTATNYANAFLKYHKERFS